MKCSYPHAHVRADAKLAEQVLCRWRSERIICLHVVEEFMRCHVMCVCACKPIAYCPTALRGMIKRSQSLPVAVVDGCCTHRTVGLQVAPSGSLLHRPLIWLWVAQTALAAFFWPFVVWCPAVCLASFDTVGGCRSALMLAVQSLSNAALCTTLTHYQPTAFACSLPHLGSLHLRLC